MVTIKVSDFAMLFGKTATNSFQAPLPRNAPYISFPGYHQPYASLYNSNRNTIRNSPTVIGLPVNIERVVILDGEKEQDNGGWPCFK